MSKSEVQSDAITFGGDLRRMITEGAIEALWDELNKPMPKSVKEKLLAEIRTLEKKLGVEGRPYNTGNSFYGNGGD